MAAQRLINEWSAPDLPPPCTYRPCFAVVLQDAGKHSTLYFLQLIANASRWQNGKHCLLVAVKSDFLYFLFACF